ncbi:MAG TPA: membrane protein insertion efficiency factor YidD [Verrucomicrobiae bacterium]|jgi:hypothetical protein
MNLFQHILVFAVRIYRLIISPAQLFLFGPHGGCRFTPTCSQYAINAVAGHGAVAGSWLAAKRICRCHPFAESGDDPVPEKSAKFSQMPGQQVSLKLNG